MFDAQFYRIVLPQRVDQECKGNPQLVPVVTLLLANGRVLDLCHVLQLADTWMAVNYFRDAETCQDMDVAFLPYELVSMVTLSLQHPGSRRMGFRRGEEQAAGETQVSKLLGQVGGRRP
ncbi:MAG: hypothetical protein HY680_06355 [Chloroflexi bacterium]|nr:hypothetical protein [Chloroflexota bacterium]